jgi:hypothetical protein
LSIQVSYNEFAAAGNSTPPSHVRKAGVLLIKLADRSAQLDGNRFSRESITWLATAPLLNPRVETHTQF